MADLTPQSRSLRPGSRFRGDSTIAAQESTREAHAWARRRIRRAYQREATRTGGTWHAVVTLADQDGSHRIAVDDKADEVVPAASVNKLGIACAVLDKIDRGELSLDQKVDLRPETVLYGDGIYHLQTVWGDRLTLANVMTAMLVLSDNTAVRLCGLVCTGPEVNDYLAAKGFARTRVEPLPDDPHRMFLGTTTARETHRLLRKLVGGAMVSPAATRFVLNLLHGFSDGVRRNMSSDERLRTATKYGALDNGRHEAGVMFGAGGTVLDAGGTVLDAGGTVLDAGGTVLDAGGTVLDAGGTVLDAGGAAGLIFSFFGDLPGHGHNYGATNPLVEAHARLGRRMLDEVSALSRVISSISDRNHREPPTVGPAQRR